MQPNLINIAKDFSRYPVGRYKTDGPYSGEAFRSKFLVPRLQADGSKIIIEFDGARGYGSSFLEEAFGGLVRQGISADDIVSRIEFRSSDKSLIEEIRGYIRDAAAAVKQ